MDLDQIKHLTPEQKDAYMNYTRCFESPGWRRVVARAQSAADDASQRQLSAPNWDQSVLLRGARLAYLDIVNLENTIDHEFALIASSNQEAAVQEDEVLHE